MSSPTALRDRTLLPDDATPHELDSLLEILAAGGGPVMIGLNSGASAALPDDLCALLRDVIKALRSGHAISVIPRDLTLTTQQAADILNVSRPTLVDLLENGQIAFEKPGRHRRVALRDVLDYQQATREARRAALRHATADSVDEVFGQH